MFGWLRQPGCPVDEESRRWLEAGYGWFAERFGVGCAREEMVLPTVEFFPERFDGSEGVLAAVSARIAQRIGVPADAFRLEVYEEEDEQGALLRSAGLEGRWSTHGAAGWFTGGCEHDERFVIGVERNVTREPMHLVATLAHELCHALLLGGGHLHSDDPAHEPMTDLATIFFGFGIFTANALLQERRWEQAGGSGWSIGRAGYLTFPVAGYALALHARARGEQRPAWARHLRPDARGPFAQAMRWLRHSRGAESAARLEGG